MLNQVRHLIGAITIILLSISLYVIYQLSAQSNEIFEPIEVVTQEVTLAEVTTIQETQEENFDTLTSIVQANLSKPEQVQYVQAMINEQYQNQYLENKNDFIDLMDDANLNIEEDSHLFLPKNPAQYTQSSRTQLDVPLLLQKDQNWRTTPYGSNDTNQLGENGCAILTLAMIDSYYKNTIVEPKEILKWSGDQFYVHNQGTSWMIFHNFADYFGYQFENFGNNFYQAMAALDQGRVVIASVNPGYFTSVGHILVIRGYDNHQVYVNDPNDDVNKMFSLQGIDESIFLAEGINYWTIYK